MLQRVIHPLAAAPPHPLQWTTEPYLSNAAALLALLDGFLSGTALAPPGASLAPGGAALLWASGQSAGGGTGAAAEAAGMPAAAWQELGAVPRSQQERFSSHLVQAAWRFLDRLHASGAAAAGAAEVGSPLAPNVDSDAGAAGAPGLSAQQLAALRQQRGLLLLQRLLLYCLQHAPPGLAQQAAAQAAQLLPLLVADVAVDAAAMQAAAPRLQLLLAATVQCYRTLASQSAAAQRESLSLLSQQQRVAACQAAANAVVDAAPQAFGLQPSTPPAPQQASAAQPAGASQQHQPRRVSTEQQQPQRERPLQELLPLLQPRAVVSAAASTILFMRHCAGQHEAAAAALQAELQAAAEQRQVLVAAAEEDAQQCLGRLRAADRLRRAAGRQAADEATQLRQRQWRDLRRALTSGRGLWAEEERPEGARPLACLRASMHCSVCSQRQALGFPRCAVRTPSTPCRLPPQRPCTLPTHPPLRPRPALEAGWGRRPLPPPPAPAPQLPLAAVSPGLQGCSPAVGEGLFTREPVRSSHPPSSTSTSPSTHTHMPSRPPSHQVCGPAARQRRQQQRRAVERGRGRRRGRTCERRGGAPFGGAR